MKIIKKLNCLKSKTTTQAQALLVVVVFCFSTSSPPCLRLRLLRSEQVKLNLKLLLHFYDSRQLKHKFIFIYFLLFARRNVRPRHGEESGTSQNAIEIEDTTTKLSSN